MSTTAGEIINASLRQLGVLAEGETPSSEIANNSLAALNLLLDSWGTERLSVYVTQDQIFTWPASTQSRTIGPSGNLLGNRPLYLDDATYFRDTDTGISYPIKILNQEQYNSIPVKTVSTSYPQALWMNAEYPDATLYLYPVPNKALEFHFVSVQEISQPATLETAFLLPPGYLRAIKYALACELAPEHGISVSAETARTASVAKRNIKRVNDPSDVMNLPAALSSNRSRYNIYAGY